jgi:hypothetical protein
MLEKKDPVSSQTHTQSFFLRIYWMLAGNAGLALSGIAIAVEKKPWFSWIDILFWGICVSLIVARYLDIYHCGGLTSESEPATPAHWRAYSIRVAAAALGWWIVSHAIAYIQIRMAR